MMSIDMSLCGEWIDLASHHVSVAIMRAKRILLKEDCRARRIQDLFVKYVSFQEKWMVLLFDR